MDCYLCDRELTPPTKIIPRIPRIRGGKWWTEDGRRRVHTSCATIKGNRLDSELALPFTHELPDDESKLMPIEGCVTRCLKCGQSYDGLLSDGHAWFRGHDCGDK